MKRALCFLSRQYLLPCMGAMAVVAIIALLGSQVLHIEILGSWYVMLPMFSIMFAVIYSFSLITLYRQIALSFNCRRHDFFWGCQATFLLFALANTALIALAGVLPRILHFGYALLPQAMDASMDNIIDTIPLYAEAVSWPVMFLLYLFLQPVGAGIGELYGRHKVLSGVLLAVYMILSTAAVVLLLFVTDGTLNIGPAPVLIALGVFAVIGIVCDILFGRANRNAVVR